MGKRWKWEKGGGEGRSWSTEKQGREETKEKNEVKKTQDEGMNKRRNIE